MFTKSTAPVSDETGGGKARGLRMLVAGGLPVPPWMLISAGHSLDDSETLDRIREFVNSCRKAGWGDFIVRSSAEGEDGEISHAGQFESIANCQSVQKILAAIAECRESAFAERVIEYRSRAGLEAPPTVHVIVQAQVAVCTCGVAFVDKEGAIVEATWGLGESLVQGWVTPDRIRFSHRHLLSQDIGKKYFAAVPLRGCNITAGDIVMGRWPWGQGFSKILEIDRRCRLAVLLVPRDARTRPAIPETWIRQLPEMLEKIYDLTTHPVDVEFAIDYDGTMWIVQARPMTQPLPTQSAGGPLVASGGHATGPARIIKDPGDTHRVQPGDVLVAPMTTPAFTTAILRASAILSEESGLLCHTAIVARELGKPCLLNVTGVCELIQDGNMVIVDADRGEWRQEPNLNPESMQPEEHQPCWALVEQPSDVEESLDVLVSAQDFISNDALRQKLHRSTGNIWIDLRRAGGYRPQISRLRAHFGQRLRTLGSRHLDDYHVISPSSQEVNAMDVSIGDARYGLKMRIAPRQSKG